MVIEQIRPVSGNKAIGEPASAELRAEMYGEVIAPEDALSRAARRANYAPLADLKRRNDPDNLFRSRLTIAPSNG